MNHQGREEMKGELEIRGYSERTISIYLKQVQNFAEYFNKPPDTLTPQHIHEYQVYLAQQKQVSWTYFNQTVCALRFFLTT
jgi:integrase/recombinase XerD